MFLMPETIKKLLPKMEKRNPQRELWSFHMDLKLPDGKRK